MTDFFEIDILGVEAKDSGDAIGARYSMGGREYIHLVDSGYKPTGQKIINHFNTYYGPSKEIDHVVVTHNDGDHTGGMVEVLETGRVKKIWMLCPWHYADELIDRFPTWNSVEHLRSHLKSQYSNLAAIEETALKMEVEIDTPFQGREIGAFTALAPSRARFLDLIVSSDRTPEPGFHQKFVGGVQNFVLDTAAAVAYAPIVRNTAGWGVEIFSSAEVRAENKMSVVQYANLCGTKILLTGDADESALNEAADFAPYVGLQLPGINRFQVPHHGSRRGVTTELFDRWLGSILPDQSTPPPQEWEALISSALEDKDHPRDAVVRAMIHRGGKVFMTEGQDLRSHRNGPPRGWQSAIPAQYPVDQEDN